MIVTFSDPKPVNLPEAYTAFALVIVVPVPLTVCTELASIVPVVPFSYRSFRTDAETVVSVSVTSVSYTHLTLPTTTLV